MNLKLILTLILVSMAVVFIVQNFAAVEISFLYWRVSMSGALLMFFTLMTGFVLGWFSHGYFSYRKAKGEPIYVR